jgi:hypothetical protein
MNFTGRVGQVWWAEVCCAEVCWADAGTDQRGVAKAATAAADLSTKLRRDVIDDLLRTIRIYRVIPVERSENRNP